MKTFGKGFLVGTLTAFGAVVGCVYAFKKTVVEPIEEREAVLDQHRRRALRKRRSSHQG